jgi:uncharacterized membrane protein
MMESLIDLLTFILLILFFVDGGKTVRHLIDAVVALSGVGEKTKKQKKLEASVKKIVESKFTSSQQQVAELYVELNGDTEKLLALAPDEYTKKLWKSAIDRLESN